MFRTGLAPLSKVLETKAQPQRALHKWGAAVLVASGLLAGAGVSAQAWGRSPETSGVVAEVALATLPPEAQTTHKLVLSGGPFPYPKDGIVFGNRERLLPSKAKGYYREYTVMTPGSRNRGARRLVCGGTPPTKPEACFYTDDHYASFRRVAP